MTDSEVDRFLQSKLNMNLATVDEHGLPNVHPVWFYYDRNRMYMLTGNPSKKLSILRYREVMSWLRAHDTNGKFSWCSVDDMDLGFGLDKFVRCPDDNFGLSYTGAQEKIISILNDMG